MSLQLIFRKVGRSVDVFQSEGLRIRNNDSFLMVKPYFKLGQDPSDQTDLGIHVGFGITEGEVDENDAFVPKQYTRGTTKKYTLHSEAVYHIVNIEAAIIEQFLIEKAGFSEMTVKYDWTKRYLRLQNISTRIKDYLENWEKLQIPDDITSFAQKIASIKLLEDFEKELSESLNQNEQFIAALFKKYQNILPIILLGVDSTLTFEYRFQGDNLDENRSDAFVDKNIIELKSPTEVLFNKHDLYRNNTFSPTCQFASAIQQANVQRANFCRTPSEGNLAPLCKSILIIGNATAEFLGNENEVKLKYNLEVIKFNNKDITIMTYDEILRRVKAFVSLYKNK